MVLRGGIGDPQRQLPHFETPADGAVVRVWITEELEIDNL